MITAGLADEQGTDAQGHRGGVSID